MVIQEHNLYKLHQLIMWNHEVSHAPFLIVDITNPLSRIELTCGTTSEQAGDSCPHADGSVTHVLPCLTHFKDNLCCAHQGIREMSCIPSY